MIGCLCIFVYIWMTSSSPGSRTLEPISWLQVFLHSRLWHEPLDGLMDFLAFLVQKLWQNMQKWIWEIPTNPLGNSYKIWGLLDISLAPETLGSWSRALKTHITAWNPSKHWVTIFGSLPWCYTGLPGWPFHGQFRKFWPFLKWLAIKKTHLVIL